MTRTATRNRMIGLVASTALASLVLTGCTTPVAPSADLSASKAQTALAKGKAEQAVEHAEAAVLADPRNAAYRAMLGAAYMEAGRFASAMTSFDDAMQLGDESPRTALSYALAATAAGDRVAALAVLDDWRDDIPAADLGLALALAGRPGDGVQVLANALRGGENTPKVRQNLAYAFALGGNWLQARIMAAEDVPADQIDARLGEWARTAQPEAQAQRVAALLNVPVTADAGQPVELALANHPSAQQLAAEAVEAHAAPQPAPVSELASNELPPLGEAPRAVPVLARAEPEVARPANFETAFAAPAPAGATPMQMAANAIRFVSEPVIQTLSAHHAAADAPRARRVTGLALGAAPNPATPPRAPENGDHLVQLGSFSSEASARRAWGIYAKRYPQLSEYDMVITEAMVRGKKYWRVSAGGFGRASARSMCANVRSNGQGCIAWAEGRPLPGALNAGVRMAAR